MKKLALIALSVLALAGCVENNKPSDQVQAERQEKVLMEGVNQIGLPAIRNFREKRQLKMILELRDQEGFMTHTYIVAQATGKPAYLCPSLGYPINDATGFTSPDKVVRDNGQSFGTVIQAEPNGLFTPDNSNAYWVMCLDSAQGKAVPVFVSGDIAVLPFKLPG